MASTILDMLAKGFSSLLLITLVYLWLILVYDFIRWTVQRVIDVIHDQKYAAKRETLTLQAVR